MSTRVDPSTTVNPTYFISQNGVGSDTNGVTAEWSAGHDDKKKQLVIKCGAIANANPADPGDSSAQTKVDYSVNNGSDWDEISALGLNVSAVDGDTDSDSIASTIYIIPLPYDLDLADLHVRFDVDAAVISGATSTANATLSPADIYVELVSLGFGGTMDA